MMDLTTQNTRLEELSNKLGHTFTYPELLSQASRHPSYVNEQDDLNLKERRNVILCLRDNCYLLEESFAILRKHLTNKKYLHCTRDERQPQYLYKNEKYLFPRQEALLELGACPHKQGTYCVKACYGCLLYGRKE